MRYRYLDTPIGSLMLAGAADLLQIIGFPEGGKARRAAADWRHDADAFDAAAVQLDEYFRGDRRAFDVPLDLVGTDFQRQVWQALRDIPYGETCSYKDIAEAIDRPKAMRAVGAANGSNPIPIIVPCHRVIGASGKLTGFGGGLPTKAYLLDLEQGREALF